MKRLLAALTLALLASLIAVSGAMGAPGGGGGNNDSASGTVNNPNGTETFSATASSLGTNARGHWRDTTTFFDPDQVITGEIRCLRVVSPGLFEARGVIVDVRNAPGFTSQGFILRGSDSGRGSPIADTYQSFTTFLPQLEDSCVGPVGGGFPVVDGEIIVKDAP